MTVRFDFNCIIIDKDGVHEVNLKSDDPFAEIESKAAEKKAADEALSASTTPAVQVSAAA